MARQQVLNPPVSFISDVDMRDLFHHNYQVFDVINGSGDPSVGPHSEQLFLDNVTGSGPLYDLDLIYEDAHPNSGVQMVQIGDNLLVAETDETGGGGGGGPGPGPGPAPDPDPIEKDGICWYRYYIRDVINDMGAESGRFRVEYIVDTCNGVNGDQSPDQLCYDDLDPNSGYGGDCSDTRVVVYRELNPEILLGD